MSDRFTLWRNAIQSVCDSGAPLKGPSLIAFLADVESELTALREKCEELRRQRDTLDIIVRATAAGLDNAGFAADDVDNPADAIGEIARQRDEAQRKLDEAAKQEPFAWVNCDTVIAFDRDVDDAFRSGSHPLYRHPPSLPALIEQARAEERESALSVMRKAVIALASAAESNPIYQDAYNELDAAIRARSGK